jgi:hypothetical protein
MKRSTIILAFAAVAIAVAVYFLEIKPGKPRDEKPENNAPMVSFKADDISSLSITRSGQTVTLEKQNGKWAITQPAAAPANQAAVDSLVSSLTSSNIERALSPSSDELKSFGLADPAVVVDIKLNSGKSQTLKLGVKDFSGLSAYAQAGDSHGAILVPASVLTNADKSVDDLRDKAILGVSQFDLKSISLNNDHGQIVLAKDAGEWKLSKPVDAATDTTEIDSFLRDVTTGNAEEFITAPGDDLSKYGLDKPAITLSVSMNDGSEKTVSFGVKDDNHYARISTRPDVLKISASLYDKLNVKPADLRSKELFKLDQDNLSKIEIRNPNLTLVAEKSGDKWTIKEPADKKDKDAPAFKVVNPFDTKAEEIIDSPSGDVQSKLAKPAVEAKLTYKNGKVVEVKISAADGDSAYVTLKGGKEVFRVNKQMLEDLSFKAADL